MNVAQTIVDLCVKHGCTAEELFATITLNPIPKELHNLSDLELKTAIKSANEALRRRANAKTIGLEKIEPNTNPIWLLKSRGLIDKFNDITDACILAGIEDPEQFNDVEIGHLIYDLTIVEHSRMIKTIKAWFKDAPPPNYLERYLKLCDEYKITAKKLYQEKNLPNHFADLNQIQLKRVMYEAMKHRPEPTEVDSKSFQQEAGNIADKLKKVCLYHSEKAAYIKSLIGSLESACIGPINFSARCNLVELNIEKGKITVIYGKHDWTLAKTEDLLEIEYTLRSLIMGEFAQWLDKRLKSMT